MNSQKHLLLTAVTCAVLLACGGNGGGPDASTGAAGAVAPEGSASITGTIQFTGTPPERQPLNLDRDCTDLRTEPALSESVVVNDDGTLRWVFVYVKEGLEGYQFPVPAEPAILDQEGCKYTPHVLGVQAGQTLRILNSDALLHNIHAIPTENRPFNFGMPSAGQQRDQQFRVPEIMVRVRCDVHPWMLAWVGVTDHPFFSVSGEDGAFGIQNLPAGEYVIEAWHETYGTQTQSVTVGDGESVTLDFTFGPAAT